MGVSALLRSASSTAKKVQDYNDSMAAFEYANSGYTDDAFQAYSDYLNKQMKASAAIGGVAGASKALSLTRTLRSATTSNVSSSIQRENIMIMAGNASPTDKYHLISSQYVRAVSNGDMTLAQSLESQAYSLSQQIAYDAQQANDSAVALAKATASANAGAQEHIATTLKFSLEQLNNDIKTAGKSKFDATIKEWASKNADTLKALGVVLPQGAAPNYFDIANGVAGAIYNAHMLAYTALKGTDPIAAETQYNAAITSATDGTLPTLAGNKTAKEIQQAANSPAQYAYDQSSGKLVETKQVGIAPGTDLKTRSVNPIYSGTVEQTVFLTPKQTAAMSALGLNFSANSNGTTGNGVRVQATNQTPIWLQKVLGNGSVTNMYTDSAGRLQFQADATEGSGKAVYTIIADRSGKLGLAEDSSTSSRILDGEYGFQGMSNNVPAEHQGRGFLGDLRAAVSNIGSQFLGHASAESLPSSQIIAQAQIQQSTLKSAQAAQTAKLALALPQALPPLHVSTAPIVPQPLPPVITPTVPTTASVVQPTVNPQQTSTKPLQGSMPVLQGGGMNLQGGTLKVQ